MSRYLNLTALVIFCFFYVDSNAQTLGIRAGLNMANMSEKYDDLEDKETDVNLGYHLGVTFELPINSFLYFESGILLSNKGHKYSIPSIAGEQKNQVSLYYLDIPASIKLKQNVGKKLKVFESIGPYVGFGVFGKIKREEADGSSLEDVEIEWGEVNNGGASYSRTDFGLTFGGGLEYNSLLIGFSYDLGLSNMDPFDSWITKKNRVLKISVGYRFVKKSL
ncbi:porin family protein [Reichenbachiella sp.]